LGLEKQHADEQDATDLGQDGAKGQPLLDEGDGGGADGKRLDSDDDDGEVGGMNKVGVVCDEAGGKSFKGVAPRGDVDETAEVEGPKAGGHGVEEEDTDVVDFEQVLSVLPPSRDGFPYAHEGGGEEEVDDAKERTQDADEEGGEEDAE